jgi:hypothetical protein
MDLNKFYVVIQETAYYMFVIQIQSL